MSSTFTDNTTVASPLLVMQYQASRNTRHLVHDVLGSNVPDVTLQNAGPRTGSMTALFNDELDAQALFDLLGGESVLSFTDTDTRDRNMT
ncbi:hypothetical protein, partial [Clavibacter michiganensis]|uniref:hypothetical protein n=1 Tax=Clavibacter michiganensis TaxID=28447 RepID=UPI00292EE052